VSTSTLTLKQRIAAGDTSTVYAGSEGDTPVAVKILHAHLAADPVVRARFLREAELLGTIRHPGIIRVYRVEIIGEQPAMVMELLEGGSLRGRTLRPEEAEPLLLELLDALAAIHALGIVHRDIRPDHILFDGSGAARIVDFGMASVKDLSGLTRSTVFSASPEYVDPHTWGRGQTPPAADIYSLGAVIYSALTGNPPPGAIFARTGTAERERALASMREKSPGSLGEVLTAMLDKPAVRPRSAAETAEWLRRRRAAGARRLGACLYCGAVMPEEAPVCMNCGREPLQVRRDPAGEFIALRKISEDQDVLGPFLAKLRILSDKPIGPIKLIIGDARLYSRQEQKEGYRIPVRIAEQIHSDSVGPLIDLLIGDHPQKIQITRYAMTSGNRVKRGPLIRIRAGLILPETTRAALRKLIAASPAGVPAAAPGHAAASDRVAAPALRATSDSRLPPSSLPESGRADLRQECRYAVAIAARSLASDQNTAYLADEEHIRQLWTALSAACTSLYHDLEVLQAVRLQDTYADLERLEADDSARARKERARLIAIFDSYAESERSIARREQQIVRACRALEAITPENAVEQLQLVEQTLAD
jgi:predicted Ser/Thr protein kinase